MLSSGVIISLRMQTVALLVKCLSFLMNNISEFLDLDLVGFVLFRKGFELHLGLLDTFSHILVLFFQVQNSFVHLLGFSNGCADFLLFFGNCIQKLGYLFGAVLMDNVRISLRLTEWLLSLTKN